MTPMTTPISALTDGETVLASAEIAAPPERVFRALTTDEVEHWWGAPGVYSVEDWHAHLVPGGTWRLGVRLPDGRLLPAGGIFLEIEAPIRLVQTRVYGFDHPTLGRRETMVTFRLSPIDGGTRLTVRQDGFAGLIEAAEEHRLGWERLLGWLESHLCSSFRFQLTTPVHSRNTSL